MNKQIMIGIGILIILGLAFFVLKGGFTGNTELTENSIANNEIKEFTVKAFRFGYSPDVIEVNKGDKVRINIDNTDTTHGIRIPDLGLKGNEIIEFVADKDGEFDWYCNNMCGAGHMDMNGRLIVK